MRFTDLDQLERFAIEYEKMEKQKAKDGMQIYLDSRDLNYLISRLPVFTDIEVTPSGNEVLARKDLVSFIAYLLLYIFAGMGLLRAILLIYTLIFQPEQMTWYATVICALIAVMISSWITSRFEFKFYTIEENND